MKKIKSAVWRFFERVIENNRCVGVVCKLCDNQYKFFGNTTNLRVHLINKHPIQWELSESGNLDDSFQTEPQVSSEAVKEEPKSTRKRKHATKNADPNGNLVISDSDQDDATTMYMVRQMHGEENGGEVEEWLEEDPFQITHIETYEPNPKRRKVRYRKIKQEIESPADLPGFYVAPKTDKIIYEEPISRKDEYSVFGEYVANKLRKIKAQRTRGNLQQLITTLLWQADYGLYDSAEAVKKVLMISVQPDLEIDVAENDASVEMNQKADMQIVIEQANEEISQSMEEDATNT